MPTRNQIAATGLETYRAAAASNVGQLFSRFIDLAVEEEDLFSLLEGDENSDRPIWIKTDLSKGGGDRVFFNTIASLGGDAHSSAGAPTKSANAPATRLRSLSIVIM